MPLVQVREAPLWRKLAGYVGPGFLVSVAYLDPGNLQTDLHAGAYHKFELLWIVLVGLLFALIIQSRSSNLGVATGKHLAEHCRAEYPKPLNYGLWVMAEVAVIAADIPEVIGTAFALNLLFKVPIWCGVLLAGLSTLLLLGVQKYGIRKLELVIVALVLVMGGCFFAEMAMAKPDVVEVMKGMFVPTLKGKGAADDAVALLGALVMPHNLFLHSALVISRKIPQTSRGIQRACRSFLVESGAALVVAFLINVAVVSVSAAVCGGGDSYSVGKDGCGDISLSSASALLKNTLGRWSSKLYAVSLLASGLSSTITGTYAGQYIMQGFLDLKMKTWLRNLTTRCVAIVPSLIVAVIGGSSGAGRLIIIASMILSFELPFTLIPLLKFTASEAKMGDHRNSAFVTVVSWLLGCCLTGINTYVLSTTLVGWCLRLPKAGAVLATVAVFSLMMAYLGGLAFLTFRNRPACGGGLPLVAMNAMVTGEPKQNGAEAEGVASTDDESKTAPPAA